MKPVAKVRRPVPPSVRVSLLLVIVGVVFFAAAFGGAGARADETLFDLGSRLMALPHEPVDEPRAIQLNGITLSMRTQVVESSLSEVLHHYRRVCERNNATRNTAASFFSGLATRSRISEDHGYVACIDLAEDGLGSIVESISRFAHTWNLAELGALRYAYAHRSEDADTFLLTMWADGPLHLRRLLPPEEGDAAGRDPTDVPRLAGTRRILSAAEASEPTGMFVYSTHTRSAGDVEAAYRRLLAAHGWTIVERHRGESLRVGDALVLHAGRGQRLVTVITHPGETGATILTLLTTEAP